MPRSPSLLFTIACVALFLSCAPPKTPEPIEGSVAESTGRQAALVTEGPGRPLVVDWHAEQRADLEVAMRTGVALVRYEGGTMELLNDCSLDGDYGFFGVTTKTELIRLKSEQEIVANLPLAGVGIAAELGGELRSGASLDVALAIIGKKRTTWLDPTLSDLRGHCEGATHFVKGATLGAFVMDMGDATQARTAALAFGVGASGQTQTSRGSRKADGDLNACASASPESLTPPIQCAALVRLELSPLARPEEQASAKDQNVSAQADPVAALLARTESATGCPAGMVMSEGKCTTKGETEIYTCDGSNETECLTMCHRNDARSCSIAGVLQYQAGPQANHQQNFAELSEKGCQLGDGMGCLNAGIAHENGWGRPQSAPEGLKLYIEGCKRGEAAACFSAGNSFFAGHGAAEDKGTAAKLFEIGCNAGHQSSCTNLGVQQMSGDGVQKDIVQALAYFKRACDGGEAIACGNVGFHYEFGIVVPQEPKTAVSLFARACKLETLACIRLGIALQAGFGVPRNDDSAQQILGALCAQQDNAYQVQLACSTLNLVYGGRHPIQRRDLQVTIPVMVPQCQDGVARACGFLGVAYHGLGAPQDGDAALRHACQLKDYWACDILARRGKLNGATATR